MTEHPAPSGDFDYPAAIDWLMGFADFERGSRPRRSEPEFALDRIHSLLRRLGSPQHGRRTVHVAGSKGKGSTAAMIESVLRAAGHATGMFSSPHLHSFTERIRIDGEPLPEDEFARLCSELRPIVAEDLAERPGRVSTFEILTALAFHAFQRRGVAVQVVEVGLGGRLDCTNVFAEKDLAVVTSLSREHTDVLGDRLEQIAAEKAGIITAGARAAILAPQRSEAAAAVVRNAADDVPVPLVDVARSHRWTPLGLEPAAGPGRGAGQWFALERLAPRPGEPARQLFLTPLLGEFQIENAAAAVAAADALAAQGLEIPRAALHQGLAEVRWPARLEALPGDGPRIVVDGAHNADSVRRALEALDQCFPRKPGARLLVVFGVLGDKQLAGMAEIVRARADEVIATQSDHPRARDAADVRAAFAGWNGKTSLAEHAPEAIAAARDAAGPDDLICVLGSLSLAAEARAAVLDAAGIGRAAEPASTAGDDQRGRPRW